MASYGCHISPDLSLNWKKNNLLSCLSKHCDFSWCLKSLLRQQGHKIFYCSNCFLIHFFFVFPAFYLPYTSKFIFTSCLKKNLVVHLCIYDISFKTHSKYNLWDFKELFASRAFSNCISLNPDICTLIWLLVVTLLFFQLLLLTVNPRWC